MTRARRNILIYQILVKKGGVYKTFIRQSIASAGREEEGMGRGARALKGLRLLKDDLSKLVVNPYDHDLAGAHVDPG